MQPPSKNLTNAATKRHLKEILMLCVLTTKEAGKFRKQRLKVERNKDIEKMFSGFQTFVSRLKVFKKSYKTIDHVKKSFSGVFQVSGDQR